MEPSEGQPRLGLRRPSSSPPSRLARAPAPRPPRAEPTCRFPARRAPPGRPRASRSDRSSRERPAPDHARQRPPGGLLEPRGSRRAHVVLSPSRFSAVLHPGRCPSSSRASYRADLPRRRTPRRRASTSWCSLRLRSAGLAVGRAHLRRAGRPRGGPARLRSRRRGLLSLGPGARRLLARRPVDLHRHGRGRLRGLPCWGRRPDCVVPVSTDRYGEATRITQTVRNFGASIGLAIRRRDPGHARTPRRSAAAGSGRRRSSPSDGALGEPVASEVRRRRSGRDDEAVAGQRERRSQRPDCDDGPVLEIEAGDLGELDVDVLCLRRIPEMRRDLAFREDSGGDLVEQRLEEVVVRALDDRDATSAF